MTLPTRLFCCSLLFTACAAYANSPPPEPIDGVSVLLENGPVQVTAKDFDAAMTRFPENLRQQARSQPDTILKVIDGVFVNRTLAMRAREAGLDKDPLVQLRMGQVQENFLAQKYLDFLEAKARVPDLSSRADELYKTDPKKYTVPATAHLRYILVSHMNRTPEMALARASEARRKLVAGTPLADVSKEYSDASDLVRKSGDLGPLRREQVPPALADAAFVGPVGQWSEPIVTPTATHLVFVVTRKLEHVPPFADVKGAIMDAEADRIRKNATERVITDIRKSPQNKVYPDRVEALKSTFDASKLDAVQRDAIRQLEEQR